MGRPQSMRLQGDYEAQTPHTPLTAGWSGRPHGLVLWRMAMQIAYVSARTNHSTAHRYMCMTAALKQAHQLTTALPVPHDSGTESDSLILRLAIARKSRFRLSLMAPAGH
eukprot:366454-Chlamydomonas_euryale.AAC.17